MEPNAVWSGWSTGTTISTGTVWTNWTVDYTCTSSNSSWYIWTSDETLTPCSEERANEVQAARDEAKRKATEILNQHLTEEQRAQFARDRFFVVRGSGGRTFRVNHGRAGNVEVLDARGRAIERLCIHPTLHCPDEDTMLAQKLAIETDEESFYRTANKTRLTA